MQPKRRSCRHSVQRRGLFGLTICAISLWASADEPTPRPASFFGAVTVAGHPVPDGTTVSALLGGTPFATTTTFTDDDTSVYRLDIPGDLVQPGFSYSVELLEAPELTSGTNPRSIYPASGREAVNVTTVGTVKVVLIPIAYGADGSNRVPETQENNYRTKFQQLYPVSDVEIEVHGTFQWNSTVSPNGSGWGSLLDAIANYRQSSGAAYNEHYYGIFMPATSFSS